MLFFIRRYPYEVDKLITWIWSAEEYSGMKIWIYNTSALGWARLTIVTNTTPSTPTIPVVYYNRSLGQMDVHFYVVIQGFRNFLILCF